MTLGFSSFKEHMQPDPQLVKIDADNDTYYGSGVDMLGYLGVAFFAIALQGEVQTYGLKIQQDSASNFATAADLAGSNVAFATAADADGFAFVEVKNPRERYVRPALVVPNVTTPNAVAVFAIRYGKGILPETNADAELHVYPAEGTA
jgi:hypothetical protein